MKVDLSGLTYISDTNWDEVFGVWRSNEEGNASWKAHWSERGFGSWEQWRKRYADDLGLANKQWKMYRVNEPGRTIAAFYGGPFKSWSEKYYEKEKPVTFDWLMSQTDLREHDGIVTMSKKFRSDETVVAGLQANFGIVIIEGMHRCCAAVLAAQLGKPMRVEFKIALAKHGGAKLPVIGGYEEKG